MSILDKKYIVTMEDNSRWAIPVKMIAIERAEYFKGEFGDDIGRSLAEDTVLLFESDHYEIADWAKNNMNWSHVVKFAECITPAEIDFEDGWCNGEYEISK